MKNITFAVLVLLFLVTGCGHAVTAPVPVPTPPAANQDWSIAVTFNYNFTNFAQCSASVTVGCVKSFTWGYIQGTTHIPLHTLTLPVNTPCPVAPALPTADCGNGSTFGGFVNALLGIGPVTPYVIVNGIDNTGAAVSSTDDLGPVDNVQLIAATNLTWNRQ